jgi:hypothetical protein
VGRKEERRPLAIGSQSDKPQWTNKKISNSHVNHNLLSFDPTIMGQRFQAFIIARVVPYGGKTARYRCVGAIHHQWCYGRLPLKALRRFLTSVKEPLNAQIIRHELEGLHGKYAPSSDGEDGKEDKGSDAPANTGSGVEAEEDAATKLTEQKDQGPKLPVMPAPYATFLLSSAWNVELGSGEVAYAHGTAFPFNILDANYGSYDGLSIVLIMSTLRLTLFLLRRQQ